MFLEEVREFIMNTITIPAAKIREAYNHLPALEIIGLDEDPDGTATGSFHFLTFRDMVLKPLLCYS